MIILEHLSKKYGGSTAVNDLSLSMEKGKIYGFLGPNGAGKSTTMNMMTGYLAPSGGRILINGTDVRKEPEKAKKCIGYLPEIPPVYPEMTVEEYLKFAAELKKVGKQEVKEQIQEIMELTRITEVKKRLIRNLSKGYRQRVGLAQAMLGYPEILILDEPTAGLDPKQMIEMREFIRGLREKHTIILSSHILSEVSAVCDHILILSAGQLVAAGTPLELQSRMGGRAELELSVKGSREALCCVLDGLEDAVEYHFDQTTEEAQKNGECSVRIYTREEEDIREQLFYRLAEDRLPILKLGINRKSLEDIFLQLTAEDGKTAEEALKEEKPEKTEKNEREDDRHESNL